MQVENEKKIEKGLGEKVDFPFWIFSVSFAVVSVHND